MATRLLLFTILCTVHLIYPMEQLIRDMPQTELNLALIMVAPEGDQREVEMLLDQGAYVDAQDSLDGFNDAQDTPLMIAAREGHAHVVTLLLARYARLNIQNTSGYTALHNAVIGGHLRIAESCLRHGADIFIRSDDGTAIDCAACSGTPEMLNLLLTSISKDDEEEIYESIDLLLCMNRMCIKKSKQGRHLAFQELQPGHESCIPDKRLKKVRALVAKHLMANLVQERMDRICDFLSPGAPAYEPIRARIERSIKCILFGDPVPKRLPEVTKEEFDPFGYWFTNP